MGMARTHTSEVVDIPLSTLHRISTNLECVYGQGNVVMIGGRAINLQCSNNARPTHDVDLVVPRKLSEFDMASLPNSSGSPNEYFYYDGNINDKVRGKLCYATQTIEGPIEIDLYYPFYTTASGFGNANRFIGGKVPVPVEAALNEHTTVNIGGLKFNVAKLEVLAVMKYNTFLERGIKEGKESKDMKDLVNIFRNHANTPDSFRSLMRKVDGFMEQYIPAKRHEAVDGILRSVDFNSISNSVGNEARFLLRNGMNRLA